jgi:hypothetical protein
MAPPYSDQSHGRVINPPQVFNLPYPPSPLAGRLYPGYMDEPDLRYPVGKFKFPETVSAEDRQKFIEEIAETPARLRTAVTGLTGAQLDTPYRPGGWTVRQVVHHVPDSHMHSYARFRLALTEDEPVIKSYKEDRWAELLDARTGPVDVSLALLGALHERWVVLLRSLRLLLLLSFPPPLAPTHE